MDRHTCKLCFRQFHNGRALGGHMGSHVVAAATASYSPASTPISLASTSSTEVDDGKPTQQEQVSRAIRDGSKKCFIKVGASEFSVAGAAAGVSSFVQDGQSDTESSPRFAVSRRRSKRARRRAPPAAPDPDPASSVSDATPEEDVAMSLVMLSRDSWTRSRSEHEQHWAPATSEPEQNNDNTGSFDASGSEDVHDDFLAAPVPRPRGRFQCAACRKVFRSYQALGGHRASMKKGKGGCASPPLPTPSKARRADATAIHECPYCFRVFGSGQALGGHKRAHMMVSAGASPSPTKCVDSSGSIDLNMPPAMDDDFELSAVYDAEFGGTRVR